eukprot:TRINITY_DN205_c2_g1_i1.p1 TRINITY_DN205_c2_g1~~TRINITY_DN205_c2_g1_i1.p1  ORF type:complete len:498 (-),score=24.20 TRINITY_DN205_c2_g1_i1:1148-2449(-)
MDLKVQLLQEKEKLKAKAQGVPVVPKKRKEDAFGQKNKGVEQRNSRDLVAGPEANLQSNLEAKAKVYEQLLQDEKAHKKGKKFLVDFEQKRWDMQEKYEEACQEYRGSNLEEEKLGEPIQGRSELTKKAKQQEEERVRWEESVRKGETKGTASEGPIEIRKVPIVKQSYDHVLTKDEKAHLPEIEEERKRQKELQQMIRKRREQEKDQRMQKIMELQNKRKKTESQHIILCIIRLCKGKYKVTQQISYQEQTNNNTHNQKMKANPNNGAAAPEEAIITMPDGTIVLGTQAKSANPVGPSYPPPSTSQVQSFYSNFQKQPKIVCYSCKTQMYYPPGSPVVRCPVCRVLNGTPHQSAVTFTCPFCSCVQQIPTISPMATCGGCRRLVVLSYRQTVYQLFCVLQVSCMFQSLQSYETRIVLHNNYQLNGIPLLQAE